MTTVFTDVLGCRVEHRQMDNGVRFLFPFATLLVAGKEIKINGICANAPGGVPSLPSAAANLHPGDGKHFHTRDFIDGQLRKDNGLENPNFGASIMDIRDNMYFAKVQVTMWTGETATIFPRANVRLGERAARLEIADQIAGWLRNKVFLIWLADRDQKAAEATPEVGPEEDTTAAAEALMAQMNS